MGPYYRATSQSTGAFFDVFYQHPSLMILLVASTLGLAIWLWRRSEKKE